MEQRGHGVLVLVEREPPLAQGYDAGCTCAPQKTFGVASETVAGRDRERGVVDSADTVRSRVVHSTVAKSTGIRANRTRRSTSGWSRTAFSARSKNWSASARMSAVRERGLLGAGEATQMDVVVFHLVVEKIEVGTDVGGRGSVHRLQEFVDGRVFIVLRIPQELRHEVTAERGHVAMGVSFVSCS